MADYQKMYQHLFKAVTAALEEMHNGDYVDAEYIMKKAQLRCEEIFEETAPEISILEAVERKN